VLNQLYQDVSLYGSLQQQAIIRARDYDLPVIAARWIL
jgi:hypothetical protein